MSTQPFRFLDLPVEMRLMVYENFTTATTSRRTIKVPVPSNSTDFGCASIVVTLKRVAVVSLLSTCRLIHKEATSIVEGKLQQLNKESIRFEVDMDTFLNVDASITERTSPVGSAIIAIISRSCPPLGPFHYLLHPDTPRCRFEIALSPSRHSVVSAAQMYEAWTLLWLYVRGANIPWIVSCCGSLPSMQFDSGAIAPGLDAWQVSKECVLDFRPLHEGEDLDSLLKVEEMKEEDWMRKVQGWHLE